MNTSKRFDLQISASPASTFSSRQEIAYLLAKALLRARQRNANRKTIPSQRNSLLGFSDDQSVTNDLSNVTGENA